MKPSLGVIRTVSYFRTREARLAELIGRTAARSANRAMEWFLAGFLCYGASFVLVWRFFPNGTVSFAILVFGLFGVGTVASVRFTILRIRSAQLASEYLSTQMGRPIKLPPGGLAMSWWARRVEQERRGGQFRK